MTASTGMKRTLVAALLVVSLLCAYVLLWPVPFPARDSEPALTATGGVGLTTVSTQLAAYLLVTASWSSTTQTQLNG